MQKLGFRVIATFLFLFASGCISTGLDGMGKSFGVVAQAAVEKFAEQGVLDQFKANFRGHLNNPEAIAFVSVRFESGIGFSGFDADASLDTEGTGTQLPPGGLELMLDMLRRPGLSDDQRAQVLGMIEWNRE